jgi:hypothetical protein
MDQRSIALYLSMKGLSAQLIHQELVDMLGFDTVGYSIVIWYLRTARFTGQSEEAPAEAELISTDQIDAAILKVLADSPFSSMRKLFRLTCFPKSIVHRHLTESLCFAVRHLRWIPHHLSDDQKAISRQSDGNQMAIRVNLSRELLAVLEAQQSRGWDDIVTLDESWFEFSMNHERIWFAREEPVPDRERYIIQSQKIMITIIWNPNGFHVVTALPTGLKFNTGYYTREILQEIKNWREPQGVCNARKLIVHADNVRSHTAKLSMDFLAANNMRKLPIRCIHLT